jgi:hypothetical protein
MIGHILCKGPRTVTNCLHRVGLSRGKRFSRFHDFFRKAKWSSFKASKLLLFAIDKQWVAGKTIRIVVDTTLERRRGPRLYGLGIHRDAVMSTKKRKAFSSGHNWLVACVLIKFPGTKIFWSLPFISILLKPKEVLSSSKNQKDLSGQRRHKTFIKYTEQLVSLLRRWLGPKREIILLADSAFCCRSLCRLCQKRKVILCTQLRLNASLHNFPPPPSGKRGRPRIVGERLPNLSETAADINCPWKTQVVSWYGGDFHTIEVTSGIALWYHTTTGKPVPIRWVLTRDPNNKDEVTALLCTNLDCAPQEVIEHFVQRWSIETTFQEIRSHLGYETLRTWADKGIERVSPCIMASYSTICLIAAKASEGKKEEIQPLSCAWYDKKYVTFSDVLVYLKLLIINHNIFTHPVKSWAYRKKELYNAIYWALAG